MYCCEKCGHTFRNPNFIHETSKEETIEIGMCPNCESSDINMLETSLIDEELDEEDYLDYDEMIPGRAYFGDL